MEIRIKEYAAGASEAEGLTVIIDVFRAFSVACYAYDRGIRRLIDVCDPEDAFELRKRTKEETILVGEREEKKIEGFDFGNSPTEIITGDIQGKTVIHTTTAGTNGILSARKATEILGAGLVNASATANYILRNNPDIVTLVAMGYRGSERAEEDVLCSEYIRDLLNGSNTDISGKISMLRHGSGSRFFLAENLSFSPPTDFFLCTDLNRYGFVLKAFIVSDRHAEIVRIDL